MKLKKKCAIIVGASSGIGAAVARRMAREGWTLALVARREEALADVAADIARRTNREAPRIYPHDVTDFDAVPALFDRIVADLGGLELVLYTSGIMPDVGPEEFNFAKDRQMVEVNLLGMMAWLNEAAHLFSRLGGGTIAGISSVAGDRGRRDRPGYNTSKGAQAIFLEALRNRLASRNVRVVTIKPGPVATPLTEGLGNMPFMISANEAARQIVRALGKSHGTVYVPLRWAAIMTVIRHIPSIIFRRMGI
ncbi:MAG: hypothetical protein PWP23_1945 [Candidatus Sumerlaeota bacterium]|nr:hypothetical protein [Candidatus Sumerlaeota bacterium]